VLVKEGVVEKRQGHENGLIPQMLFRRHKKRILLADNDSGFLGVTRSILKDAGFAVDIAEDGESALKQIRKQKYDLLILDVVLPKIDGSELFKMARKSKRYEKTPVFLISGHWSKEALDEEKREIVDEANGYLEKPIDAKRFLNTVRTLAEK